MLCVWLQLLLLREELHVVGGGAILNLHDDRAPHVEQREGFLEADIGHPPVILDHEVENA